MAGVEAEEGGSNQLAEGRGHTFVADLVSSARRSKHPTTKINPVHCSRTIKMST